MSTENILLGFAICLLIHLTFFMIYAVYLKLALENERALHWITEKHLNEARNHIVDLQAPTQSKGERHGGAPTAEAKPEPLSGAKGPDPLEIPTAGAPEGKEGGGL